MVLVGILFRGVTFIGLWFFVFVQAAYKEGDVILGGLFNVHQLSENSEGVCGELSTKGLGRAQAMIFAIENINSNSSLLPNITLGYDIRDYCENATRAMEMTYDLVKENGCTNNTRARIKQVNKSIMAVIGPFESRTALVIGGFLQMLNVPAISGTTTSPELSSYTYRHLYRTVPPDTFLAKAMTDIIEYFNWSYVAAVGLDDTYGRNGVWSVVKEAASRKSYFCIAMTEFIPHEAQFPSIRNIVTSLRRQENIKVILLWTYGSYQRNFFSEVNRQNLTKRIWILSEVSVTSKTFVDSTFFAMKESLGFQPHRFYDAGFKEHIIDLLNEKHVSEWWNEAKALRRTCSAFKQTDYQNDTRQNEQCTKAVVKDIYGSYVPYVIDAVYSFANAIEIGLAEDTNNTEKRVYDMRRLLSRVNFVGLSGRVTFDEFGDRQSAVYDIVKFQQVHGPDGTRQLTQEIVGKWEENGQNSKSLRLYDNMHWKSNNATPPKSECPLLHLAWQCVPCPRGTMNTIPGSENCIECPKATRSNDARTKCVDLPLINLKYSTSGGIVILTFVGLCIVVTIFSIVVFCLYWNTPIVRASNRKLSLGLLVIIILMLSPTILNLFEPTDKTCKIIYPWRYIAYNLCLSLLLVKVLKISSAFQIPMTSFCTINSLTSRMQGAILITLQGVLLLLLLPWLILDPPISLQHIITEHYIFVECKAYGSLAGRSLFLLTFSYVLLQTLLCAFCSFKIRNVPENLGEAKRIAFSMYIFLFSMLAYHPVEFLMDGWYVTVVDSVTTLLSSYGFLCCLFLPKIYIIIFRQELNNVGSLSLEVTQYSFRSNNARVYPALNTSMGNSRT